MKMPWTKKIELERLRVSEFMNNTAANQHDLANRLANVVDSFNKLSKETSKALNRMKDELTFIKSKRDPAQVERALNRRIDKLAKKMQLTADWDKEEDEDFKGGHNED